MDIKTVGVIGAGVMGAGVAQNLAQFGIQVVLIEQGKSPDEIQKRIRQSLRADRLLNAGQGGEDTETILRRISITDDYQALSTSNFVIENIPEKWDLKQSVYRNIDKICEPSTIFAANTSAISITRIASVTSRRSQVLGIHFMNPVPTKKTVEVISGYHTSQETLDIAKNLLTRMGKQYVTVTDSPGFVTNRVLMLTINEAIFLLQDGVAPAKDVDQIFRDCLGHAMGPLETADLIGLDTILFSIEVLQDSFGEDKYRPCPLLKKMVDAGLLGRKTGRGFHDYQ